MKDHGIALGAAKEEIDTPALLIDLPVMEANLRRMADFFRGRESKLRPHAKTHKCPPIADQQLKLGAIGITCAKLEEAEVLVAAGIRDILIANQVVGRGKLERLASLTEQASLLVAVDGAENIKALSEVMSIRNLNIGVLIEVDIGMARCGVPPGQPALALARQVAHSPGLRLAGLMGYEGHLVFVPSLAERTRRCRDVMALLLETRDLVQGAGFPVPVVSGGGTGTYSITGQIKGITEVQAGSYLFMDTRYRGIEGLDDFGCALSVYTTVISRPREDRAIIDAGMKAVTHEFGFPEVKGKPGAKVIALAEEHGIISMDPSSWNPRPGDKIELVVSHCCTTINLHTDYFAVRDGRLEAIWPIAARGAFH